MKLVRESLLFEGMAERETALRSKFRTLDDSAFAAIVKLGYDNPQLVPYIDWLLTLYKNGKLKLEDIYKAEEYLTLFNKQSVKNRLERNDINQYEDLVDLYGAIEPYKESEEILSDKEIKEKSLVKHFKNYSLYIPRSYEDSCILGAGTEWCTASGKTRDFYDTYTNRNRKLFIFISNKDPKKKFQLEFYSKQFMNKDDKSVHFFNWLESNVDINIWLEQNYEDEMVYFSGVENIVLSWKGLTTLVGLNLPQKIRGDFNCCYNNLRTLEGAPQIVVGNFYCYSNKLTTLVGAPQNVSEDFDCSGNNLTMLEGAPQRIGRNFICSYNNLTTLKGAPQSVGEDFFCTNNILSEKEIERYRKTGAVKGNIYK